MPGKRAEGVVRVKLGNSKKILALRHAHLARVTPRLVQQAKYPRMPVFVMLVTLVTLPQPQERVLCVVQANTLVVLQTLFVFAQTVALDNFQQRLERLLLILVRIAQRTRQRLEEAKGHLQTVFAMLVMN